MRDYLLVTKAIADESRVRILKLLEEGELCVCQIQAVIGLGQSTVSKHLSILKHAGLVDTRKEGIWIYYFLAEEGINSYVQPLLSHLHHWLKHDRIVLEDLHKLVAVKAIPLKELCKI